MPEGDTILRTARSLDKWLVGRAITAARTTVAGLPAEKLVGRRVDSVEARAKHLLIRFDSGVTLHTHMRMTGSWHVYRAGERWRKPGWQARVVLEAGDRVAVCFSAPVVELLARRGEEMHPALTQLGPDVLVDPLDLTEVRRRLVARCQPRVAIGEVLLDQRVVSGIGNIYRCEALFACRVHPAVPWSALDDGVVEQLVATAARFMRANLDPGQGFDREFGGGPARPWVYGRTGRPCYRCRTLIVTGPIGDQARDAHWCPTCQAQP